MNGITSYINAHTENKAIYNELIWISSIVVGSNSVCSIPNQKDDRPKFILIKQIALSLDGLGSTIDFVDGATNDIIFSVINNQSAFIIQPFEYLFKNVDFKIRANNTTIKYSVAYQTISQKTV